ncbi:MAG: PH domain-containing protein [Mycobacteriaceae bacterium]
MSKSTTVGWDAEFRPRLMRLVACSVAAFIAVVGIVVAILNNRSAGANLRGADQIAMAGLALLLAGGVLILTRPRVRVGPAGVQVRNVVEDRLIPWAQVVDVSFPAGKRWARVDLEAHEYVPLVAVQSVDRERAVSAMDTIRQLMARYRPGSG